MEVKIKKDGSLVEFR